MTSTDLLKSFLGDTYALMIKTHFCHWNMTGAEFFVLHALFEKQYTELFEAADVVAERVREHEKQIWMMNSMRKAA